MKFKQKKYVQHSRWFFYWIVIVVHSAGQAQVLPSSQSSAGVGHNDLVLARSLHAIDRSGGGLTLPDGSVIKTVWPAALEVTTITDNPKWANQPARPRCEPAVYSLARVMPNGQELWTKSYIFKSKVTEVCYAEYLGFDVRSGLDEVEAPGYYRLPFAGSFFVGEPTDPRKFEVDVVTGSVVGFAPKNLRVVDAAWLRQVKEKIWSDAVKRFPDMPLNGTYDPKQIKINKKRQRERTLLEKNRYTMFFREVENTVFATNPTTKN